MKNSRRSPSSSAILKTLISREATRLSERSSATFVCEISLDGMPDYHDKFRGNSRSFSKAMETYDMLAQMRKEEPRLQIHANTVAMSENMDEMWSLTEYLHDRCPSMEHHNLAIIR